MKKALSIVLSICLFSSTSLINVSANNYSEISGNKLTNNQAITAFETGTIPNSNARNSSNTTVIQVNQTVITGETVAISGAVCEENYSKEFKRKFV